MSGFIVDASVAAKWFVEEDHSDIATEVLEGVPELAAPDLLLPEVANVMWKKVQRRQITSSHATRVPDALLGFPLQWHTSALLVPSALDLAIELSRTVYDCIYLALAIRQKGQVLTEDVKFHRIVSSSRWAGYTTTLAEFNADRRDKRE